MARIVSTLAGVAAVAFAASAGTAAADCFSGHKDVTASVSQPQDNAAMSTYDGQQPAAADQLPPSSEEAADAAKVAETPEPKQ